MQGKRNKLGERNKLVLYDIPSSLKRNALSESKRGVSYTNTRYIRKIRRNLKGIIVQELEERIQKEGIVKPGNVLKVDAFLNHQCDCALFDAMGSAWAEHFKNSQINKILTIESSGIGIACVAARHFGNVPVVFAKKAQSINLDGDQYVSTVFSFTKQREFPVIVSRKYLNADDRVLILDDFLANGKALQGLIDICNHAGATVAGIGIAIEKGFQGGGDALREAGYDLDSLAIVDAMDPNDGSITFRK